MAQRPNTLSPDAEGRRARRQFSAAFMADTKWRKLIAAVEAAHTDIGAMAVKFIDVEEPRSMRFPPSLACPHAYMDTIEFGPVALRSIEWLELPADVSVSLEPLGRFPLEATKDGTRVIGYRR